MNVSKSYKKRICSFVVMYQTLLNTEVRYRLKGEYKPSPLKLSIRAFKIVSNLFMNFIHQQFTLPCKRYSLDFPTAGNLKLDSLVVSKGGS